MTNVNQRIGQPFGDIYTPNTSHTDRLSQQLYAEEKQREAKDLAMQAALDDEFSKNLTVIRDIDTDDLTKAYGDFKLANKAAMRQRDGISPKQQMELLKKKQAMYDIINKSKYQKGLEDGVLKGLGGKDRYDYEPNSHEILMKSRATPLSKLGDLYGYDYSYKGTDTDFQKIDNLAIGQPKQVYAKEDLVDESGIQTKITPYMFGNTPSQYYEGMLGALSERKAGRDAAILIGKVPTEILQKTQEQYLQIPIDKWERMGVGKAQDLTITPNDSKAQVYAKHKAQLYALNNEPKEGVPTYRTNEAKKMAKEFANKKEMDGLNFKQAQQLILLRKRLEGVPKGVENEIEDANNLHKTLDDISLGEDGRLNVSPLLNGIQIVDKFGDKIVISSGKYDPVKKDFLIKTNKGEEIVPYHKLATLADPTNPLKDAKWLKGFKTYQRSSDANNKQEEPKEEKPKGKFSQLLEIGKKILGNNKTQKAKQKGEFD